MEKISELFWKASCKDMAKGYIKDKDTNKYICLVCGESFEKGVIYKEGEKYYEAEKYAQIHIAKDHDSMFDYLVNLNKKVTGLTDTQKNLLQFFYEGLSDNEIVKEKGGSPSTVRNQRFTLKEKEKQSKVFLAIMQLLDEKNKRDEKDDFVPLHRGATMIDDRYAITNEENEAILKMYFKEGLDGPLSTFPIRKEKRKIAILRHLIKRFERGAYYTEKEVNEVLKAIYSDHVLIRRYLIEYGFMDRENDGSKYWVKE